MRHDVRVEPDGFSEDVVPAAVPALPVTVAQQADDRCSGFGIGP